MSTFPGMCQVISNSSIGIKSLKLYPENLGFPMSPTWLQTNLNAILNYFPKWLQQYSSLNKTQLGIEFSHLTPLPTLTYFHSACQMFLTCIAPAIAVEGVHSLLQNQVESLFFSLSCVQSTNKSTLYENERSSHRSIRRPDFYSRRFLLRNPGKGHEPLHFHRWSDMSVTVGLSATVEPRQTQWHIRLPFLL